MARYINRKCPRCRDYFGLALNQAPDSQGEHPISGYCAVCGYQLKGWRLILGRNQAPAVRYARTRKVFR
jgi:hypothetical protein